MTDPQAVLDVWFGTPDAHGFCPRERAARWFRSPPGFDALLREHFGAALAAAARGELEAWARDAPVRGRLALIVLTDQFSRNVHRGSAAAFATDSLALAHARAAVDSGTDRSLPWDLRAFHYLPFEHAEDVDAQDEAVRRFEELLREANATVPDPGHPGLRRLAAFVEHAREHRAIVRRFGRFPHRNAVLGRQDTPLERRWLREGRRFGQ